MKLTDLLNAHHPLEIEYQLLKSYPETHQHILSYRKVLAALKQLPVEETSTYIVIKAEHDEMGSHDVYGVDIHENGEEISLALAFTPWSVWLAMDISAETLQHFGDLEIIVHCLYEMTTCGFDEEDIHKALLKLIEEKQE